MVFRDRQRLLFKPLTGPSRPLAVEPGSLDGLMLKVRHLLLRWRTLTYHRWGPADKNKEILVFSSTRHSPFSKAAIVLEYRARFSRRHLCRNLVAPRRVRCIEVLKSPDLSFDHLLVKKAVSM